MTDTATLDTTRPSDPLDLAALRGIVRAANPHGLSEREVMALLDAGILEDEYQRFHNTFTVTLVASLLDRIEELERRDVYDAERAQTWNAAVALRGAVRVALDEWHKFTDHLDDSIAVHDILLNAYQDTAGKIP